MQRKTGSEASAFISSVSIGDSCSLTGKRGLSAMLGTIIPSARSELRAFVERQSGQNILDCYQCGKCSAGCPADYVMDLGPRRVMRAIQLGLKEEVLASTSIWLCLSCQTCSARCPANIDIARVMESLRWLAAAEKSKSAEKNIKTFHRIFLGIVRRFGRAHELSLAASYNLLSKHFFANLRLVPGMIMRGKIALLPPKVKSVAKVKEIFQKAKAIEEKK